MADLQIIKEALSTHDAARLAREGRSEAAVAMVLRERGGSTEALFIERARHPADPWSGHMAFPGGRRDPDDTSLRAAAERETLEEVGLDLRQAEPIGRLDDLEGYRGGRAVGLVIGAFVYHHPGPGELTLSREVAEALWVPVPKLHHPDFRIDYMHNGAGPYPGIRVSQADPHVVWGLTYRFVETFLGIIGSGTDRGPGPHP